MGIDPGVDLEANDRFLVGGRGGKVFLGLAGGRGNLETSLFLGSGDKRIGACRN